MNEGANLTDIGARNESIDRAESGTQGTTSVRRPERSRQRPLPLSALVAVLGLVAVGLVAGAVHSAQSVEAGTRAHQLSLRFIRQEMWVVTNESPVTSVVIEGKNKNGQQVTWRWSGMTSQVTTSGWWWADGWVKVTATCANTRTTTYRWIFKNTSFTAPWISTLQWYFVTNC